MKTIIIEENQTLEKEIQKIAESKGLNKVFYGTGSDIYEPCIIAVGIDFLTTGTHGYNVWYHPQGQGYNKPYELIEIIK